MRTIKEWAKLTGRLRSFTFLLQFMAGSDTAPTGSDPVRGGGGLRLKDWAESFYKSPTWNKCRRAYISHVGGLCERCLAKGLYIPGVIVHHKIHLTPDNIADNNITCSYKNLELLCRNCHAEEHSRLKKRYRIDENGRVMTSPPMIEK